MDDPSGALVPDAGTVSPKTGGRLSRMHDVTLPPSHSVSERVSFEVSTLVELSGGEILVECLKAEGVDTVFGYRGGAVLHIY
ncbi:MAG TPA: hypothetical protein ENO19_10045, partial [Halothiobacillaceae bacterium]|nr:hypothetical protein [Halothiobacillaceae bacterium]